MSVIIPRGTKIPVQKESNYITSCDNQEEIYVGIFEGEKKYVNDNHLLGEFCLTNLPKRPEGEVSVTVNYSIDTNGILIEFVIPLDFSTAVTIRIPFSSILKVTSSFTSP